MNVPNTVKVTLPTPRDPNTTNVISTIKAIRTLSGLSLKDAKIMVDNGGEHMLSVLVTDTINHYDNTPIPAYTVYKNAIHVLRQNDVKIDENSARERMINDVRKLITEAVLRDEFDLAQSLIDVVRKFS